MKIFLIAAVASIGIAELAHAAPRGPVRLGGLLAASFCTSAREIFDNDIFIPPMVPAGTMAAPSSGAPIRVINSPEDTRDCKRAMAVAVGNNRDCSRLYFGMVRGMRRTTVNEIKKAYNHYQRGCNFSGS